MNTAVIAVAGAGKTERLAKAVLCEPSTSRTIVLTYTTTNQLEDSLRIASSAPTPYDLPRVTGWRSFLLNEIVKPYLPKLYPNVSLQGLAFNDPESFQYLKGYQRYISADGWAYPSLFGKLAFDVIKASGYRALQRIEHLYDSIYIDEGQDLRGNDLCVLEALLKSSITIHIVLDPRQSTLSTAARDKKYREKYQSANIINLFRLWEKAGRLTIETMNETWRFTPQIAHFSDLIFEDDLNLGETVSNVPLRGRHDGLFLISKSEVAEYSNKYQATALAVRKSQEIDAYESINFGLSKGMSRDDVVIVATAPIEELLTKGKRLLPSSACGLYVAVTRARYSVAIAVEQPNEVARAMHSPDSIWKDIPIRLLGAETGSSCAQ